MKKIAFLALLLLVLQSCRTQKDIVYFQNINQVVETALPDDFSDPAIQVGDELRIIVSALDENLAKGFNLGMTGNMPGNNRHIGYLVDSQGNIDMPVLGEIHVEGKTRNELASYIKKRIEENYFSNPIVNVRINNFRVVMLGEFNSPGVKGFNTDRVSVIEAIGSSGDMKFTAIRDSVLVIRNVDGVRTKGYLNLLDADAMNSPYFYLKQNDIVYAMPTKSASMAFNKLPMNVALSVIGFTLTIVSLFR